MKKLLGLALLATGLMTGFHATAQEDKSKRPSPPAKVTEKITTGATISIDYSQPSVKGRTIGKDLEPMEGQVWRTGANEATVFETDKDLQIENHTLPAGKYSLFTIYNKGEAIVIFNKTWKQWGAFKYDKAEDQLRIAAKIKAIKTPSEKMTFTINNEGFVTLLWGATSVEFQVR